MSRKISKVGIIGAGNVGADVANALVLLGKCVTVVLFDRTLSKAEGQAWDIEDTIPLLQDMEIIPSNQYEDLADSDIIVVTVGVQQKEGQSRLDILSDNAEIMRSTIKELDRVAPNSIILIVSNPVDVLTRIAIASSTRAENLIFGSGTVLDTARLRYQLGKRLNVSKQDVHVYVIGEHGDSEFVVWSSAFIGGILLAEFPIPQGATLEEIQQEYAELTRKRGYNISERKGNTSYGISIVVCQLVDAILRDEKQIFPVSVIADSNYGVGGEVVLGLPCIISSQGIERQLVLPRNAHEQRLLEESATKLNEAYSSLDN
ncbi:L-lactate dehydrogenase [Nostoc sp. 'Peltigera membranacea cyanobiont' 210A]|uniref:L-lactate dehydrogenase n=1 Tax=Nostoc sp. 'Peltigera membranacea cyanobiont' 210A TaxID=2014529 RepID=UPI000B9507EB|nr:L-lactate dehydrogenase [Nostoc sp. 'Peltigera membranacea cyanobiont' 210A]OYD96871.1 L-lactate dehydrogenase [Nostoc sp. 'Peltigera membranacea cyanobiont' 210A]